MVMEAYLVEEYGVLEDEEYLKSPENIVEFVQDLDDLFNCGQGYYNDFVELIVKIGDKFYNVMVTAEIMSSKQEYGDRLYWVDHISNVEYHEIEKPKSMKNPQIEAMFTYHPPKDGQSERYTKLRDAAKDFAYLIDDLCPNSREKSLAFTNLQQVSMWANAAISMNE